MKLGNDPASLLVLTALERSILHALAQRLGEAGSTFRAQCDGARVVNRSHSGVGFVTRLVIPEAIAGLSAEASRRIGPVRAAHPELRGPAEFLVQMQEGRLRSIEAYCHDGFWPADEAAFRIEGIPR